MLKLVREYEDLMSQPASPTRDPIAGGRRLSATNAPWPALTLQDAPNDVSR